MEAHGVGAVADVRAYPGSRRLPHFNRESLADSLATRRIDYHHLPALGGRRRPRPDAPPTGWRVAGFQAYADYMTTPEFAAALHDLEKLVEARRCAVMCAEVVPWRCHRTLISDALLGRGYRVLHIISAEDPGEHTLTAFARVHDGRVTYLPKETEPSAFSSAPQSPESDPGAHHEQRDLFLRESSRVPE